VIFKHLLIFFKEKILNISKRQYAHKETYQYFILKISKINVQNARVNEQI